MRGKTTHHNDNVMTIPQDAGSDHPERGKEIEVPETMKMTDVIPLGGSLLPSCHSSRVFRCDLLMWMNAYLYI